MTYVILGWLAWACLIWYLAARQGRSAFAWFVLALFFGLFAGILLFFFTQYRKNHSKECPNCEGFVGKEAAVCPACGQAFPTPETS